VTPIALLVAKDVRSIVRSRVLLVALLVYPVLLAVLVGLVAQDASHNAVIALVNQDNTGKTLSVGGSSFGIAEYKRQAERSGIKVRDMSYGRAIKALNEGEVAGVLVIPEGFMARLQSTLAPSDIEFHTGSNALGDTITERVRGAVYRINLQISGALIKENAGYLRTIVTGGDVEVLGQVHSLYGLQRTQSDLAAIRATTPDPIAKESMTNIIRFAHDAQVALGLAKNALRATASPVRLDHVTAKGKSPLVTAKALSFAIAVSLAFMCVILVAASLAAERDERVLGRLLHGPTRSWQVLMAKLVVGALLGLVFALGVFVILAVATPQSWSRLPLLLVCVLVSGLAFSSLGALIATLARDARTATLVSLLVVVPVVPLAFATGTGPLHLVNEMLPFVPSWDAFNGALFDAHPMSSVGAGLIQLAAIAAVVTAASSRLLRRLT
jgi:ABC-type multidrug transport system permease subunit